MKDTYTNLLKSVEEGKYTAICSDSRKVVPGSVFVAIKGYTFDGHEKIADAIAAGAYAIVYDNEVLVGATDYKNSDKVVFVKAETTSRRALAFLADAFYGHPSSKLRLVGITGTNGKTTTVTLLYNLFTALGYECGMLSTISNRIGSNEEFETTNTTSDPLTINSLMKRMNDKGCEFCFMEVSSVGVEQDRIAGLDFKVGIFSNLTHDHLDYHKTFAEYLRCKKLFFDRLDKSAIAITNVDDKNGLVMVQNTEAKTVTYSLSKSADHHCKIVEECFEGMNLIIDGENIWTRLIGRHNAYNLLAAYATAISLGFTKEEVLVALSKVDGAKGRLENIRYPKRDLSIIIDYAHTPDALENVLNALRDIAEGRKIITLFGCGGDRDATKRPEMGKIAADLSDRVIVTSDNSRSEKTEDIMKEIVAGMDLSGRSKALKIADRAEAIRTAIVTAEPGSVILLAGKGHETYQILDNVKRHFDEREVVAEVLAELN
ncbi:MAG: UDP-N-acetylmuramoyl-L-alanyl-D-glutamate--2,6-diaminopimelate ligase [Bacteroidales bacterium]|nr:UDP-N-acetylmuramoyl-L-alanyl-D-glutamate--2,6-diaminopimelate ligase [Bacteroidales bacterium]